MSDDPTGQEPTTPPAGQEPAAPEPTTEPAAGDDQVKALRGEAAKYRTERNALQKQLEEREAKLKEYEQAQLSDQEKLTARLTEAEARAQQLEARAKDALLRAHVTSEAVKAGITDVDAARLLLPAVGEVEYDDAGEPANVADLVKALVENKPYLVAQADDGPAPRDPRTQKTTPAAPKRSTGGFTAAQVQAFTPEDWRRLSPAENAQALAAISGQ